MCEALYSTHEKTKNMRHALQGTHKKKRTTKILCGTLQHTRGTTCKAKEDYEKTFKLRLTSNTRESEDQELIPEIVDEAHRCEKIRDHSHHITTHRARKFKPINPIYTRTHCTKK